MTASIHLPRLSEDKAIACNLVDALRRERGRGGSRLTPKPWEGICL